MVDDALISARYAHHIASGDGYRFNSGGEISDGVTPLGWAYLLAPFAGDVLGAFRAAKAIGLGAWLAGAASIGVAIHSLDVGRRKWLPLMLIATLAPLAAWSVAGMETGLCLGIAALAVSAHVLRRQVVALVCCAVVAGWRPEALPWAMVMALAPVRPNTVVVIASRWLRLALVAAPFMLAGVTRWMVFGRFAPLSLLAKPSDLTHGAIYALAAAMLTGTVALLAFPGLPSWIRGLQLAVAAHFLALVVAGGDWMPLARLTVIALPTLIVAAAYINAVGSRAASYLRVGLAVAGALYALIQVGPASAAVGLTRLALIEQMQPVLSDAKVVASLDIGWVGAATEAQIVDLAGVTDPAVAALAGGHTTRRVPLTLLEARGVDTLVLLLERQANAAGGDQLADPWPTSRFDRYAEHHLAGLNGMAETFEVTYVSHGRLRYVVLRRRGGDS